MSQPQITLYTVPHTGTNFMVGFLRSLVPPGEKRFWARHHAPRISPEDISGGQLFIEQGVKDSPKLVVTGRDPYLSAIRYFHQSSRANLIELSYAWGRFLNLIGNRDYFVVDIGCREEDRMEMMCNLLSYLRVECDASTIERFVYEWKPVNDSDSKAKNDYLANGSLPALKQGETWELLDDAVAWYESLPTNDYKARG